LTAAEEHHSFPEGIHEEFRRIRRGHFWFENRRRALAEALRASWLRPDLPSAEIGCGDGFLLPLFPGKLVIGLDLNVRDLALARHGWPGTLVCCTAERLPFRKPLGLIGAFDVIEHLPDETIFLKECCSMLADGGRLVITVPASPALWNSRDEFAGHYRRYARRELISLVESAGFGVDRIFPLFRVLYPAMWVSARLDRFKRSPAAAPSYVVHPAVNVVLNALVRIEWSLFSMQSWGAGTSWCVVADKK
jgi:SAM-dependent methyltransferase